MRTKRSLQEVFDIVIEHKFYGLPNSVYMCNALDNAVYARVITEAERIQCQEAIRDYLGDFHTLSDYLKYRHPAYAEKQPAYVRGQCLSIDATALYRNWANRPGHVEVPCADSD